AVEAAKAKLDATRSDYEKAKVSVASLKKLVDFADKSVELKQRDYDRKAQLVRSQAGSEANLDTAAAAVVSAELQAQLGRQQLDQTLAQLLGDPNLPLEKFPEYAQA